MGTDLASRVAAQSDPAQRPTITLRQQIQTMTEQFQAAMPRGFEAAQLVRDALTCLSKTPKLAQCDATSVMGGLMTCAQLGLRPAVLGQAWLLPLWNGKSRSFQAQLIIGYQGYAELAYRSSRIATLDAYTVYANDKFDVDYGLKPKLKHKPMLFGDRGEPIAYYSVAQMNPNGVKFEVLSKSDAEKHRDKFAMAKTKEGVILGPWRDHFDEMAKKTTVLRLAKLLPKSPELMIGMSVDGGVRLDLTPKADPIEVTETMEGEVVEEHIVDEDPWAAAEAAAKDLAKDAGYSPDA